MSDCHCTKYVGKRACIHDLRLMVDEQADTIDQQAETIARVKDIVDNYSQPDRHSACVAGLLTHLHLALRDVSENTDTASNDSEHRQDPKPEVGHECGVPIWRQTAAGDVWGCYYCGKLWVNTVDKWIPGWTDGERQ
ncbi:MAG: hypothetical protein EBR82_84710 [Caulobacteraceae bacterium]|nr:hypothetical protein [Caulobacteraceae bacterium]